MYYLILKKSLAVIIIFFFVFTPAFAQKNFILYHSPKDEMLISHSLKSAHLSVSIYKIGVANIDGSKMALVQFGINKEISRSEVARNAMEIISRCFAYNPRLLRVDIYGTDKPDVPGRKGEIMFSVSAKREKFLKLNSNLSSKSKLKQLGLVYYSDSVYDVPARWLDYLYEYYDSVKNKRNK